MNFDMFGSIIIIILAYNIYIISKFAQIIILFSHNVRILSIYRPGGLREDWNIKRTHSW
jgi:hypothetical protein